MTHDWREQTLGVFFFDLQRFARWAQGREDLEVATFLQQLYERAAEGLEGAGATIVKFMGDAGLGVFPTEATAGVIDALRGLRSWVRGAGDATGFETDLVSKVHVGTVIEGRFGAPGAARYDVMGRAVNETALLKGSGLVLSREAYERLPPESRDFLEHDAETGVWREP